MAALVYALWTEDRHDDGHPQLRGLFASLRQAQLNALAQCTLPLSPWKPALGYVDNALHGGEQPVEAHVQFDAEKHPLGWCVYTVEPMAVEGRVDNFVPVLGGAR